MNPVPENIAFIEGDYEWSNSGSINESTDSYGITISKKGYIYTYKNGKLIQAYKIEGYYPYTASNGLNYLSVTTYSNYKKSIGGLVSMSTPDNFPLEIRLTGFPFNEENVFYHHE